MAWKRIEQKQVICTPKLAKEFAEMEPAPNDRPKSDRRCEGIRGWVLSGSFRSCEWASVYCAETKKTYRVNGKHTSTVLAEMNGTAPKNLPISLGRYHADTLRDVAALYATFDHKGGMRSTGDINFAFAASSEDVAEVHKRTINTCTTGIAYATWEGNYNTKPAEERALLMLEHKNFVVWFNQNIGDRTTSNAHIHRGPVVAAMFRSFQKSQKAATEFWMEVLTESNTIPQSPSRKLSRHLLTSTVRSIRATGGTAKMKDGRKIEGYHSLYCRCLHAWNAFRRNATTDLKYYEGDTPDVV